MTRSEVLYIRLARAHVALFRFLLEAHENLALFSSLGTDAQGRESLLLRFAPGAGAEVRRFLEAAATEFPLELLPVAQHDPQGPASKGRRPG